MTNRKSNSSAQKGAALIIVLMLVATLSFIVLSMARQTVIATERSFVINARHDADWRLVSAEALAIAAIDQAYKAAPEQASPDSVLFTQARETPIENGVVRLRFVDRTACLNVNSLVTHNDSGQLVQSVAAKEEFAELIRLVSAGSADQLTSVIVDWIDQDQRVESGGAEDGFYSALPVPYRTGETLLSDVSELRAMSGVTPALYATLHPWLCAYPKTEGSLINVNQLQVAQAPILSALTLGAISLSDAARLVENRPPGGFGASEEFWTAAEEGREEPFTELYSRIGLKSRYIDVVVDVELTGITRKATFTFEVDDSGRPRLLSRRLGDFS